MKARHMDDGIIGKWVNRRLHIPTVRAVIRAPPDWEAPVVLLVALLDVLILITSFARLLGVI